MFLVIICSVFQADVRLVRVIACTTATQIGCPALRSRCYRQLPSWSYTFWKKSIILFLVLLVSVHWSRESVGKTNVYATLYLHSWLCIME